MNDMLFSDDNDNNKVLRLLANDNNSTTSGGCIAASSTTTSSSTLTDTEIIHNTCSVYLSIFAILFITFLTVRQRYPHIYNIKKFYGAQLFHNNNSVDDNDDVVVDKNIAENEFGKFNWTYKLFTCISYTDIRDQCGMDAVTTIRLLEYGVKLSLVGIFNSFFLLPIYKLSGDMVANENDPVKEVSLSNLGQGSDATLSTTLAAYIFFGAAMYLMSIDFDWFLIHRHNYLSNRKNVQNYSVYLSNLPSGMQTNESIMEYFQTCFFYNNHYHNDDDDDDDDARGGALVYIALSIPKLEKEISKRTALLPKLEHAINIQTVKGETPMHKQKTKLFSFLPISCGGTKVDSISTYSKELEELNEDIYKRQKDIRAIIQKASSSDDASSRRLRSTSLYYSCVSSSMNDDGDAEMGEVEEEDKQLLATAEASEIVRGETADSIGNEKDDLEQTRENGNNNDNIDTDEDDNPTTTTSTADTFSKSFQAVMSSIKSIIKGGEDGAPRNAAFVTFANLTSTNIARQTVHQHDPVACIPVEPPTPEFVK